MTRLPIVDFRTMEKLLLHLGFHHVRQKGSHVFYHHPHATRTTVRIFDAAPLVRRAQYAV